MTPFQIADASKCYCYDDETWKKVILYLLSVLGGGGGSVQDMQVAWTPTNVKLGELVGFNTNGANPTSLPGITNITFLGAHALCGISCTFAPNLVSFSAPNLLDIDPTNIAGGNVYFTDNPMLTAINLPLYIPRNGVADTYHACALSASMVNAILAMYVANPAFVSGSIDLTGGTNAAPSGQGIADKATLIGRGVTVNTN